MIKNYTQMNSRRKRKVKLRKWFDQQGLCAYCGDYLIAPHAHKGTVLEHVYPRSLGGKNVANNLVLSCKSCDVKKAADIWVPIFVKINKIP